MNKYRVSWRSKLQTGSAVYEGKNQCDILIKILKALSLDGVHALVCRVKIESVKE